MGIKKGLILFGPFSNKVLNWFSKVSKPPMPEVTMTAVFSFSSSVGFQPESSRASFVAAIANCENLSSLLASLLSIKSSGLKSFTSPAIFVGKSSTENFEIREIPDLPFLIIFPRKCLFQSLLEK